MSVDGANPVQGNTVRPGNTGHLVNSGRLVNTVHLVGRVSAVLDERVLPSGDFVVPLRVVVPRPSPAGEPSSGGSRATVDVIDVACWSAPARQVAGDLAPGDHVEVHGSLHRRFFRGGGGVQSRYEVSAHQLTRCNPSDSTQAGGTDDTSDTGTTAPRPASSTEPRPPPAAAVGGPSPEAGPRLGGHDAGGRRAAAGLGPVATDPSARLLRPG